MHKDTTKRQYWAGQISAWQASGLTQAGYCAREGLKYATFAYWRQRLATDADKPAIMRAAGNRLTLVALPLPGQAGGKRVDDSALVLRNPGGWALHLPAGVEPAWLLALLGGLQ